MVDLNKYAAEGLLQIFFRQAFWERGRLARKQAVRLHPTVEAQAMPISHSSVCPAGKCGRAARAPSVYFKNRYIVAY